VRLARAKVNQVCTGIAQAVGFIHDGQRGGYFNAVDAAA
jgi:hypothetical protein